MAVESVCSSVAVGASASWDDVAGLSTDVEGCASEFGSFGGMESSAVDVIGVFSDLDSRFDISRGVEDGGCSPDVLFGTFVISCGADPSTTAEPVSVWPDEAIELYWKSDRLPKSKSSSTILAELDCLQEDITAYRLCSESERNERCTDRSGVCSVATMIVVKSAGDMGMAGSWRCVAPMVDS